ncbi:MAG: glutamic-type intramembrane protease PrsW [Caldibacillus sp.]
MLAVISAGLAPGLALLSYFYLREEIRSEPIFEMLRSFLLGAILVFPIMFIQYVMEVENVLPFRLLDAFIRSSLLEEFFKWFIIYFTAYRFLEFQKPYDGIIYGVAVSLGYASAENILYLMAYGFDMEYALLRAFLPVSSHAVFGVIMGYYYGKSKFANSENRYKLLLLALFVPFFLHGLYDYILLFQNATVFFIVPFMFFIWYLALRKVKKIKYPLQQPLDL